MQSNWEGKAPQFSSLSLTSFLIPISSKTMKKDTVFLLIKVTIKTKYKIIHDAIGELQTETRLSVSSTPNVQVLETEIVPLNTKN
jgi:hypothetical protein